MLLHDNSKARFQQAIEECDEASATNEGNPGGMFSFLKNINFSTQQTVTSESLEPGTDKL